LALVWILPLWPAAGYAAPPRGDQVGGEQDGAKYGYFYKGTLLELVPSNRLVAVQEKDGSFAGLAEDNGFQRDALSERQPLKERQLGIYRLPKAARDQSAELDPVTLMEPLAQAAGNVVQPVFERGQALLIPSDEIILGFERAMARKGIFLPPRREDPAELLCRLGGEAGSRRLVLLGDVKHRIPRPSVEEEFDLRGFFRALLEVFEAVDVCPGNHDGGLAEAVTGGVNLHGPRGFRLGSAGFFHGHTWPDPSLLECSVLLMGHSHPTVWFLDPLKAKNSEPCWVRARLPVRRIFDGGVERRIYPDPKKKGKGSGTGGRADAGPLPKRPGPKKKIELLMVPALSPYGSGCAVNDPRRPVLGPLGTPGMLDMGDADVYTLDGVHLGRVRDLPGADAVPPADPEAWAGPRGGQGHGGDGGDGGGGDHA